MKYATTMAILAALTFFACKTTENRPVKIPAGFDWQGHRGCRGLMPENSLPAFLHALDFQDVTTLELDLAVSKDRQLIVSHEPFFNPEICLQPDGSPIGKNDMERFPLYALTAEEIKAYDCGTVAYPRFPNQQKIKVYKPTFKEVVTAAVAKRPGIRWNIEIKTEPQWDGVFHPPVADFCEMVVAALKELGIEKTTTVQSFDVRALNIMHRIAPEIRLAYLIENVDSLEKNLTKIDFVPDIYSPYYLTVNKKMVRQCREKHMDLIPWTVNDVKSMRRLIRLGVTGIITDYPDLIGIAGIK